LFKKSQDEIVDRQKREKHRQAGAMLRKDFNGRCRVP